jgi:hypothetical protein
MVHQIIVGYPHKDGLLGIEVNTAVISERSKMLSLLSIFGAQISLHHSPRGIFQ